MDLKQLNYFVHVAELGSYTRAAEFLNVAQPILSRQIRQLETELRRSLLIRHGRGVELTEAGETLLKHSRTILKQLSDAREALSQKDGLISGRIVLGIPPTLSRLLAVDIIKRFRTQLPHASLGISEGLSVNLQSDLLQGRIQVALLYNPPYSTEINTRLLQHEQLHLIATVTDPLFTPDTPITADQLAQLPLIMPRSPNTYRSLFEREMASLNQKPNIILEIDSIDTMLELVAEEMGYAILSPYAASTFSSRRNLKAIPLRQPMLDSNLFVATSNKHAQTRLQRELVRIISEVAHDYFPPLNP